MCRSSVQQEPEEQDKLSTMAVQLVTLVEVMDKVVADQESMDTAAQQFDELLQVIGTHIVHRHSRTTSAVTAHGQGGSAPHGLSLLSTVQIRPTAALLLAAVTRSRL